MISNIDTPIFALRAQHVRHYSNFSHRNLSGGSFAHSAVEKLREKSEIAVLTLILRPRLIRGLRMSPPLQRGGGGGRRV